MYAITTQIFYGTLIRHTTYHFQIFYSTSNVKITGTGRNSRSIQDVPLHLRSQVWSSCVWVVLYPGVLPPRDEVVHELLENVQLNLCMCGPSLEVPDVVLHVEQSRVGVLGDVLVKVGILLLGNADLAPRKIESQVESLNSLLDNGEVLAKSHHVTVHDDNAPDSHVQLLPLLRLIRGWQETMPYQVSVHSIKTPNDGPEPPLQLADLTVQG